MAAESELTVTLETATQIYLEWKINSFCSLLGQIDKLIASEPFTFSGKRFSISMYPNEAKGCVHIYLHCWVYDHLVRYRFQLKMANNTMFGTGFHEYRFKSGNGISSPVVIDKAVILSLKDIFLPSGNLTVVCFVCFVDSSPLVETSSQTSSPEGNRFNESLPTGVGILTKTMADVFLTGRDSDITIKVKGQEFEAHRLILAARSEVFAAMLQHDMTEKNKGYIDIQDCDPKSFKDFLLYVYTGKDDYVTSSNASELYRTSDKYALKELKERCVECMSREISVDSFCDTLLVAAVYNETELQHIATEFFIDNLNAILQTPNWQVFLMEHHTLANELLINLAKCVRRCE